MFDRVLISGMCSSSTIDVAGKLSRCCFDVSIAQLTFIYSTIETLDKAVRYIQS